MREDLEIDINLQEEHLFICLDLGAEGLEDTGSAESSSWFCDHVVLGVKPRMQSMCWSIKLLLLRQEGYWKLSSIPSENR